MNESLKERVRRFLQAHRHRKAWEKLVGSLAVVVVFVTSYLLILPAITMEKTTYCGNPYHTHTASCYEPSEEILDEENLSRGTSGASTGTPAHSWADALSIEGIEEIRTGGEDEGLAEDESESESESEMETESESETEETAVAEAQKETGAETVEANAESKAGGKAEAEQESEYSTEMATEMIRESVTEQETETDHEALIKEKAETEEASAAETQVETEAETEAVSEDQSETVTEADDKMAPNAETNTESELSEDETETLTEMESETETELETETAGMTELESEEPDAIALFDADRAAVNGGASDLYQYIDKITIEKNNNGAWESVDHKEITEGDEIRFTLEYSVPNGLPDSVTSMQYQLPASFKFDEEMSGNVTQMQGDELVAVGTYTISKEGLIEIRLNPDKFQHNEAFGGNLQFTCKAQRTGDKDSEKIEFPGGKAEVTIKKNTSGNDFTMEKKSSWDPETKKISYTLTAATQKGTGTENVAIFDFFRESNGNRAAAQYDRDSFKVYKVTETGRSEVTDYKIKFDTENGKEKFLIEGLSPLAGGEKYVVEYTASVTDAPSGGGEIANQAYWKAKWSSSNWKWNSTKISDKMITKNGWLGNDGSIQWQIEVNPSWSEDIDGYQFADSIDVNEIVGKIKVDPAINGKSEYEPGELNSIVFPAGNKKYTISYKTKAPAVEDTSVTVRNEATIRKDDFSYSAEGDVTISPRDSLAKTFQSEERDTAGNGKYKWSSDLTIPAGAQTEILYRDELLSTVDPEHNWQTVTNPDGTNPHYAIASELSSEIRKNENFILTLEDGTVLNYEEAVRRGYSVEMSFENEQGKPVAETDSTTHVAKFYVKVSKQGTAIYAKRLQLTYLTHADYSQMPAGSGWVFKNKGFYRNKDAEASHSHNKGGTIFKKQIGVKQGDTIQYYDEDKTISYKDTDGYLYYRLVLKTEVGSNDELVITDTLGDSGMEFKTGKDGTPDVEVRFDNPYNAQDLVESKDWWENSVNYFYSLKSDSTKPEISVNGRKLTVRIKAGKGKQNNGKYNLYNTPTSARTFYIAYAVKIRDDADWDDPNCAEKVYGNSAEWAGKKTERTTKVNERTVEALEKTGVQRTTVDESGTVTYRDMIDYSIVVNPKAMDLNPSSDTVTLRDQLTCGNGVKAYLDLDSVKVYEYDPGTKDHKGSLVDRSEYTVAYDGEANQPKMTIVLKDETAYVVSYTYVFDKGNMDQPTIQNSANLEGQTTSKSDLQLKKNTHSASVYNSNLTIYKVNSEDYSVRLGNAGFSLEKYDEKEKKFTEAVISTMTGGGSVQTDEDGKTVYITNADGYLRFSGELKSGKNDTLKKDVIYKLTEVQAPEGYIRNETPYYFVIMSDKSKESEWNNRIKNIAGTNANIHCFNSESPVALYVPNDFDGVTVRKIWQWNDGTVVSDASSMPEITVELYRQTEGGQEEKCGEAQLNAGNNWTYTWSGLEKTDTSTNKVYLYTVKEIVPNKFEQVSIANNGVQVGGKEMVITNRQLITLPETGGTGTSPYVAGGFAVLAAGLLYGASLRRRRERRIG